MPQIDITLKSTADASGIEAMSRGLNGFSRQLDRAAEEYEQFGRHLAKKFSGADFGKEILAGLGIGSGMAVAEKLAELIVKPFRDAAEQAKAIEEATEHSLAATREIIKLRSDPGKQLADLKKDQADWEKRKKELDTPKFGARTVTTFDGQINTIPYRIPLTPEEDAERLKLSKQLDDIGVEIQKVEKGFKEAADAERAATDEAARYALEVKRINELVVPGGLTRAEGDERIAKLKREFDERANSANFNAQIAAARKFGPDIAPNHDITPEQEAEAAAAAKHALQELDDEAAKDSIRKAREEVEKFDIAISQLDANPALSDQEKFRQRVDLLNQQTAAIQRLKSELEAFAAAHPNTDVAGLTTAVDQLAKQAALNAGKIQPPQTLAQRDNIALSDLSDPAKHFQSVGAGARGGIIEQISQIGTAGDQAARAMQTSFGGAMSSIQQGLNGLLLGTMNLGEAGVSVWNGFLTAATQAFTQMLAEYAVKKAAMFAIDSLYAAKGLALSIANAAKSLIAWIPSAIAASISSFGVAAAVGTAAVLAVAAGSFADGGPISGPGGPRDDRVPIWASNGEWIAPAWQVDHPVYGPMIGALEAARTGRFANGGFLSWLFPTPKQLLDRTLHPPGSGALGRMLGLSGGGGSQTFAYNYDTQAWTRDVAGSITKPGFEPRIGRASGGGPIGSETPTQVVFVDYRNHNALDQLQRDPQFKTTIVRIVSDNRQALGVRV